MGPEAEVIINSMEKRNNKIMRRRIASRGTGQGRFEALGIHLRSVVTMHRPVIIMVMMLLSSAGRFLPYPRLGANVPEVPFELNNVNMHVPPVIAVGIVLASICFVFILTDIEETPFFNATVRCDAMRFLFGVGEGGRRRERGQKLSGVGERT